MFDIDRFLGKYVRMLINAYNPDRYPLLVEENWRVFVRFFCITLMVSFTLFFLTLIPVAVQYIGALPNTLGEVQKFELCSDIEADHAVTILSDPSVVLDMQLNATKSQYDVVLSGQGMIYPKYILFGSDFVSWSELKDVKRPTDARDALLYGIVLFLLPSIMFWFAVLSVLKLFLVFLALVILGYTVPKFFKHRMRFVETVKVAVLAMPSVMIIGVGLSPIAPLFWWGLLLSVLVFGVGIVLISERVSKTSRRKA